MSNNLDYELIESSLENFSEVESYYSEYGKIIRKVKYRNKDNPSDKTFRTYYQNPLGNSDRQLFNLQQQDFTVRQWDANPDLGERPDVPLYNQPDIEAADTDEVILICEGEGDAKATRNLGFVSTTNYDGAGKWQERYTEALEGRPVALMQDEDESGVKHCLNAAKALYGRASSVRIIRLPNLPNKGDVRDWIADQSSRGHSSKEIAHKLRKIIAATPKWSPLIVADGNLIEMIDKSERELRDRLSGVYVRGNSLVRAVRSELPAAHNGKTTSVRMMALDAISLMETMGRFIVFKKAKRVKKVGEDGSEQFVTQYLPTDPPHRVAAALLAPGRDAKLPTLAGVISCPTLRQDGSILDKAGFDDATGLLVVDPLELPADMPATPSKADAIAALEKLKALLTGFDYVGDGSRSAGLSLLMTPVLRPTMEVAPIHVINAPAAGSGKSFHADITAAIMSGERAPVTAAGWSSEELEKRLAGPLLEGAQFQVIDNVNGELSGEFLCQAVERPLLTLRRLGSSDQHIIRNKTALAATGIGITVSGDMVRRALLISLDPNSEKPEQRKFDSNPLKMVMADRPGYVAAILTIVRAYILAGRPGKLDPLGSFGEWSDNIRSSLVWLGEDDPLKSMEVARKSDDKLNIFRAFVSAWWECEGAPCGKETVGLRSADLMERWTNDFRLERNDLIGEALAAYDRNERFRDALNAFGSNSRDQLSKISLGKALSKKQNAIVDGLKLISEYDSDKHVNVWKLKSLNTEPIAA
ncbi:hypothetical protein [Neorhizobium sp. NCHU2750]|uniref:hypothetical protein n=1 Tax=Neorhizobium sp. NCHU2750 TaxID=1825976 RepID=UPI000E7203D5|nr:topoisomerase [Neorhizobium sp. NCHU2750]